MANYFKARDNESPDDEHREIETFEFNNFEPFMAFFRRYRLELSETEKQVKCLKA